jgi:hypothetical protein
LFNFKFFWKSSKVHDALPNVLLTLPNFSIYHLLITWIATLGFISAKHRLNFSGLPKFKAIIRWFEEKQKASDNSLEKFKTTCHRYSLWQIYKGKNMKRAY